MVADVDFRGRVFVLGVAAMALILVVSNYLVQFPIHAFDDHGKSVSVLFVEFPIGDWLTWAAFTYPFAFLVTDCVNRWSNAATAMRVVMFGFVFGVPLSFAFNFFSADDAWQNAVRISIASGVAFVIAQGFDVFLFDRLQRLRARSQWWLPPLASSTPASVVDNFCFFSMAFVGTGVPWVSLAVGDLAVKLMMIPLLLLPYRFLLRRFALPNSVA